MIVRLLVSLVLLAVPLYFVIPSIVDDSIVPSVLHTYMDSAYHTNCLMSMVMRDM